MKQTLKTGLKKVCILLRAVKMHFMIGRIFMNQESKVINVHLEKRENKVHSLLYWCNFIYINLSSEHWTITTK